MITLVGVSGRAGHGKDTVAAALVSRGFVRRAFADPLKAAAREIFGLTHEQLYGADKEKTDPLWGMSPRVILQRMGTEAMRGEFGADLWIRAFVAWRAARPEGTRVVVPDVRFPNEADAIRRLGGEVWRVARPGVDAVAPHVSETALDHYGFNLLIRNTSTIEALDRQVQAQIMRTR